MAVGPPRRRTCRRQLQPLAKVTGCGPPAELVDLAGVGGAGAGRGRLRPFLAAASPPARGAGAARARRRTARPAPGRSIAGAAAPAGRRRRRRAAAAGGRPARRSSLAAAALGPTLVVDARRSTRPGCSAARLRRAGLTVAVAARGTGPRAAGGVDVVVGARAAAWAPVPGLAAVVVLDEHDEALQEERAPTWHARDVAVERARRAGVPVPAGLARADARRRSAGPATVVDADAATRSGRAGRSLEVVDRRDEEPWQTVAGLERR